MATLVSAQTLLTAKAYVRDCGYRSAVLSGIVPDQRHLDRGGYHCSVEDLRRFGNDGDFSNSRGDDRNFNIKYAAAIDVSLSPADMRLHHSRVHAVFKDLTDPRRKYFNAVNSWDGSGDAVRLDFVTNTSKYASPDHKWHGHHETRRRYLLDPKAARAQISVLAGEAKAAWIAREDPPAPRPSVPKPTESTPTRPAGTKPPVKATPAKPAVVAHKPGSRELRYVPGKEMTGADVRYLQLWVGRVRMGAADGVFGAKTRDGLSWYQRMRGLRADGICGPATWRAMGVTARY